MRRPMPKRFTSTDRVPSEPLRVLTGQFETPGEVSRRTGLRHDLVCAALEAWARAGIIAHNRIGTPDCSINKFRLGDRSERIAALADEWGCSVTVATTRLLDAGLAAVDRDHSMTPNAIRRAFEIIDADKRSSPGGHTFGPDGVCVCGQKYTDDPQRCTAQLPAGGGKARFLKQLEENARLHGISVKVLSRSGKVYDGPANVSVAANGDLVGEISMEAIEAAVDLFPPAPQWPTLPDTPGKRMFDEWTREQREAFLDAYQSKPSPTETMQLLSEDDLRAAILNGYSPTRVDPFWAAQNGLPAPTTNHANSMMAGPEGSNFQTFPSPACGGWGNVGWRIPKPEDILIDASKMLDASSVLGLQITDETRDAMSGKGSFVLPPGVVDESCPGCGCRPGDGPTEGCTHPDGCGYYEDEDPRSMGWVSDKGLP